MRWDSSRPVPWDRLVKEWLVYAGIMVAVFLLLFRDRNIVGAIAGILISGPLYLVLGAVLAKFGYTRKTLKQMRSEDPEPSAKQRDSDGADAPRERRPPAPTKRTSGGTNRPTPKQKRR